MLTIRAVPAFQDNYIWLIQAVNSKDILIVDPGDAEPVIAVVQQHQLKPVAILITHHHADHIGGIDKLVAKYNIPVYDSNNSFINTNNLLAAKESFPDISILAVAGHTADHIAFLIDNNLFCGDTLFGAGCGRLLGGTADQLFNSLALLAKLPPDTNIYCAHEYTLANLAFAVMVEPNNSTIQQRIKETQLLRQQGKPSLPSTIELELKTNPFLRCDFESVKQAVEKKYGQQLGSPQQVFTMLRKWKDNFRG